MEPLSAENSALLEGWRMKWQKLDARGCEELDKQVRDDIVQVMRNYLARPSAAHRREGVVVLWDHGAPRIHRDHIEAYREDEEALLELHQVACQKAMEGED